jgi:3-oxoadipate enol-lactonase
MDTDSDCPLNTAYSMGANMKARINGMNVVYTDEGKGPALVFLHGFPLNRATWQKQLDAFRASYRIIAPDLRGLGESEAGSGATTMAQFAEDTHELLKQVGVSPIVLIGHSMGGYVALAFARQFPQMLKGLVLVATRSGNDTPEAAAARRDTADKVKAQGSKLVVDAMATKMLSPSNSDPRMVEQVRGFMAPSKPEGVIGALLGMAERPDATDVLASIKVPTLVITGEDDTLIPPTESEKLSKAIRGSRLEVIPQAGHLVAFEQPDAFNRAMTEWLNELKLTS